MSPSPSAQAPPQYDIGAPLITIGPVSSGLDAATIIAAQPPWQLPTIAGFGLCRMQLAHAAHELLLGRADVEQRLPGLGLAEEDHEVDRMALAQRDAYLRVVLEAADAGTVAGARVDDHVGTPLGIDVTPFGRDDAHQRVVDRAGRACAHRRTIS